MAARKTPTLSELVLLAEIRELLFALLLALEFDEGITRDAHFQRVGELLAIARQAYSSADNHAA